MSAVRQLVPRTIRHGLSARLARMRAARLERDLAAVAAGTGTIVAGPWLGEVGFELLYWAPFLRWFAERFEVAPSRLVVVSRGGTASWYSPFAGGYQEIFETLTPEAFRQRHDERVAANGEQKQTRVLAFEHQLLQELTPGVQHRRMLHPSSMFRLFAPFWWGHVGPEWVHERARYRLIEPPPPAPFLPREPYTAVKFYFNECFPATDANRAFVRRTLHELASHGPVVSLATGLHLDDHGHDDLQAAGVVPLPAHVAPRDNLMVQTAAVAGAAAFVGTYGGFSYLAPFLNVRATAYFTEAAGYAPRHLQMAQSALATLGGSHVLDVRHATTGVAAH
jgi:hypothetical protein